MQGRLADLRTDDRFYGAEGTVGLVFSQWPENVDFSRVHAKVVVLNALYATNIYDTYRVAEHIVGVGIDERLDRGDLSLVPAIAKVRFGTGEKTLYSFATKYCSWHRQNLFQIYDGYVDWVLWEYRKAHPFAEFFRYQLREYIEFVRVIDAFRQHFGLAAVSRKDLDKFLWAEGREHWR